MCYCVTNRGPNPDEGDSILAHKQCIDRGDYQWNVVGGRVSRYICADPSYGSPITKSREDKGFHLQH
jgi:hypothetical protein